MSVEPNSSLNASAPRGLNLLPQQSALQKALEQRDHRLGRYYLGALWVLADKDNPDRIHLAAHGIRELMEKLPEYLDVPSEAQREALKPMVREVEDSWSAVRARSACFSSGKWDGAIDGPLRKLLVQLDAFFSWFVDHHPRRKQEMHLALVRIEGSGRSLPPTLADLNIKAWEAIRDFFVNVAHHRNEPADAELMLWLDSLERFLLERMVPRTFDVMSEVDALIEGAES